MSSTAILAGCSNNVVPNTKKISLNLTDGENSYVIDVDEGENVGDLYQKTIENRNILEISTLENRELLLKNSEVLEEGKTYYVFLEPLDTIEIKNVEEFKKISSDKNYRLTSDLDFNGEEIELDFSLSNPFRGFFNGNGHKISNYKLKDAQFSSIFNVVSGTIYNLKVDTSINESYTKIKYFSPLVGYLDGGNIRKCINYSDIRIKSNIEKGSVYLSGIAARNNNGKISRSVNYGNLENYSNLNTYVGGICAYNSGDKYHNGVIDYCYSQAESIFARSFNQNSSSYSSGVAGFNFGKVSHSFGADLKVKAYSNFAQAFAGSVVGDNNGGRIENSIGYSDVESISDEGYSFAGNVVGRNFKSSLEENSGTFSESYGYDNQKIVSNCGNKNGLSENLYIASLSFDEIQDEKLYQNLNFSDIYIIKDGYFPSFGSVYGKINNENKFTSINSLDDLLKIDKSLNDKYILKNDLIIKASDFQPIGNYEKPFKGIFDGNGKTINVEFNSIANFQMSGIFGYLNGVVKNLNIVANVDIDSNRSNINIGALAGFAQKSSIQNIKTKLSLKTNTNGIVCGGIAGVNEDSTIINSFSEAEIETKIGQIESYIGGLVGRNSGSIIKSSSISTVNVKSGNHIYVGGLIGKNLNSISSSYSITNISSSDVSEIKNIGGLVGANIDYGAIKNSYTKAEILNSRESKINLIGGFSGDNLAKIENCYYFVNEEIKYSAGESLKFMDIKRVDDVELKTLSSRLGEDFYDDASKMYPKLKHEENL